MSADVLVAGIGNIFLGDDGFGPEVVRHLAAPGEPALPAGVRPVDYGIRGMHLIYDLLEGYSALVIVDALPGRAPRRVVVLEIEPDDLAGLGGELRPARDGPGRRAGRTASAGRRLPPTYVVGAAPESWRRASGSVTTMSAAVGAPAPRSGNCSRRPWPQPRPWAARSTAAGRTDAMCLGIPGRVVELVDGYGGQLAMVDVQGATRRINLGMLDPDHGPAGR